MTLILVPNKPFSFLMCLSPLAIVSFGTSAFAFMTGFLLSSWLFFVSAPSLSCCTSFINKLTLLVGDLVTASFFFFFFLFLVCFLLYFQRLLLDNKRRHVSCVHYVSFWLEVGLHLVNNLFNICALFFTYW